MAKLLSYYIRKLLVLISVVLVFFSSYAVAEGLNTEAVMQVAEQACLADTDADLNSVCEDGRVSTQTAIWLFIVVLGAFVGLSTRKKL